jgi:hypothetical protein
MASVAQRGIDGALGPARRRADRLQEYRYVIRRVPVGHLRLCRAETEHPVRWDGVSIQQSERG